jgi:hypothetical protein
MTGNGFSIVVFPFLKTSGSVLIGGLNFRSTDETRDLPADQAAAVSEVAEMLFLMDDLRIKSASYAVVPFGDVIYRPVERSHLSNVQAAVAYLYTSPHEGFGNPFLSSEHASLVIFSPERVEIILVRPDFHVELPGDRERPAANKFGQVPGYGGLYNFRHHFWVTRGSRVYGPTPNLTLNYVQDLSRDVIMAASGRPDYQFLLRIVGKAETANSIRALTAVRWFNAANREANDDDAAIVNLAIAFEALLGLPQSEKTDRFVDAIALLLGRTPRLNAWAQQFYDARSRVAHEGRGQNLRFIVPDSTKGGSGSYYQSLLAYGRQIFQLCLGTLLVGAQLAEQAGLEEKLMTNQERFAKICKVLADENVAAPERLVRVEALVSAVERYRFVGESGLTLESMIGTTKLAAKAMLGSDGSLSEEAKQAIGRLANRTFGECEA